MTGAHDDLPGLRLRIYNAQESCGADVADAGERRDLSFEESITIRLTAADHQAELLSPAGRRANYTRME
jgi:hypothetical protein